ncbi:MAG TPA: tryptophan 2,3-dioxygenase family protein [Balneolales bacterium]|nr:tryptophan 2,3-dioxygenase family protein [Balneolales bacterium]
MALTYAKYLNLDKLLDLQKTRSKPTEHDETLFIIIHQAIELWFKQIINELELLRNELEKGHTWKSIKTFNRILEILKSIVGQTDILETMSPLSYKHFRTFLENASGFQSTQFQEIELFCGLYYPNKMKQFKNDSKLFKRLKKRLTERTLWESFCTFLSKKGYPVDYPDRVNKEGLLFKPSQNNQDILINIMNNDHEIALLCELFVDFDEELQEWRYRHVKMVERTIGSQNGTGKSNGIEYLKSTLHQTVFPDLWAIRSKL